MKHFKFLVMLLLMAALAFSTCGDDGGDNSKDEQNNSGDEDNVLSAGDKADYTIDGVSFVMIYVPGGKTFPTGSNDLGTPATVTKAYWSGETEVTYELWHKVRTWAIANGYRFGPGREGSDGANADPTDAKYEPVTTIYWRMAMVWCNALTEWYNANNGTATDIDCVYYTDSGYITPIRNASGNQSVDGTAGSEDNPYVKADAKGFRLLTRNEWELAARYRGTDTINIVTGTIGGVNFDEMAEKWTKGDSASGGIAGFTGTPSVDYPRFNPFAWYGNRTTEPNGNTEKTQPVKRKTANTLGLYDMSGNVWEWCFGLNDEHRCVFRGAGWNNNAADQKIGDWGYYPPYYAFDNIGFRFARTQ